MYLCFFSAVVAILEGGLFRSLFEQLGILPFRQAGFRIGLQSLFLRWDIAMLFRGDSDKGNWRLAAHVLRHFAIPFIDGGELDEVRICPESIRLPLNCRCFGFRLHLDRVSGPISFGLLSRSASACVTFCFFSFSARRASCSALTLASIESLKSLKNQSG